MGIGTAARSAGNLSGVSVQRSVIEFCEPGETQERVTDVIADVFGEVKRGGANLELQFRTEFLRLIALHNIHRPRFMPVVKTKLFTIHRNFCDELMKYS